VEATSKRQAVPRQIVQRTIEAAEHRAAFLDASKFATRLKTPRGLTPTNTSADRYGYDSTHFITGLNTLSNPICIG